MQGRKKHGRLAAGVGACLVAALALILAPSLATGGVQVIKESQIDCVGPPFTGPSLVTVDLIPRGMPCPGPFLCSSGPIVLPVGTICGTGAAPGNVMPALTPPLAAACLPLGIAVTNVAGPGGPGASIFFRNKNLPFDVCVNGVNVNPGPPGTVLADGPGGPSISFGGKTKTNVPALSAQGAIVFLILASGALFLFRRRRTAL